MSWRVLEHASPVGQPTRNTVILMVAHDAGAWLAPVSRQLEAAGIKLASAEQSIAKTPRVALVEQGDPRFWFEVGIAVGRGAPVILVGPQSLTRDVDVQLTWLDVHLPDLGERVLREFGGVPQSHVETPPQDGEELLRWLREDASRAEVLGTDHLETLITALLDWRGLSSQRVRTPLGWSLRSTLPSQGQWMIQCLSAAPQERLGIRELMPMVEECTNRGMDFGMFVTNARFSDASVRWAGRCAPAMHLVDSKGVLSWVSAVIASIDNSLESHVSVPTQALRVSRASREVPWPWTREPESVPAVQKRSLWTRLWHAARLVFVNLTRSSEQDAVLNTLGVQDAEWVRTFDFTGSVDLNNLQRQLHRAHVVVLAGELIEKVDQVNNRRTMQVLAQMMDRTGGQQPAVVILCPDSILNRMRTPTSMASSAWYWSDARTPGSAPSSVAQHPALSDEEPEVATSKP